MNRDLAGTILLFGGMFECVYCSVNNRMDTKRRIIYLLHGLCFMLIGFGQVF